MNDAQFDLISKKLDVIANGIDALVRLGVIGASEGKSQSQKIWLFTLCGFPPRKIAEVLNTSPNTVRVALSNFRKSRRQQQGKRRSVHEQDE